MTNWRKQVDLGDIFAEYENVGFEKTRDATVAALREARLTAVAEGAAPIITRMERTKTEKGFNSALDRLWDWADANRVWIQTF